MKKTQLIAVVTLVIIGSGIAWILTSHNAFARLRNQPKPAVYQGLNTNGSTSRLDKSLAKLPALTPLNQAQFRDYGSIGSAKPENLVTQRPSGPSMLGKQAITSTYQGIVYKPTDTSYRILYGKLADKSEGIIELTEGFELIINDPTIAVGPNNAVLHAIHPPTIDLETTKVVSWTNLPDNSVVVEAMLNFKKHDPNGSAQ